MFSPLFSLKTSLVYLLPPPPSILLPNPLQLKSLHPKFPFPFLQHQTMPYYNPSLHLFFPHCPVAPIYFPSYYSSVSHGK